MSKALFWFRQDLRIQDNPGLSHACHEHGELLLLYILDPKILNTAQAWWLHHSLSQLKQSLSEHQMTLVLKTGQPEKIISQLIAEHGIETVYWNRCYEPDRIQHDQALKTQLKQNHMAVNSFNSALLHEPWTIKNQQGLPFKVFTPYWKNCLRQMQMPNRSQIARWPKNIISSSENLADWNLLPTTPNWAIHFEQFFQPGENGARTKLQSFIQQHLHHYKHNIYLNIPNTKPKLPTSSLNWAGVNSLITCYTTFQH
jgi:deoxyribodipyrimidine photo-lyase